MALAEKSEQKHEREKPLSPTSDYSDEELADIASMAAEVLRSLARPWRSRVQSGRLSNQRLEECMRLIGSLDAASRLLEPDGRSTVVPPSANFSPTADYEERFRLLVESVTDYAIFMLDPQGYIASWNTGAQRIKGYRPEDVIGRHFSMFFTESDLVMGKPARELDIAAREGRYTEEGWRLRKNGDLFWASVTVTALHDANGELRGFAKVTRDLTERRHAEELVRQSEERQRLLIENVKDYAIFMLDPQGAIMTWNAGAQNITGYHAEEVIGKHFSILYPREEAEGGRPQQELETARTVGRYEEEGWRVARDGRQFWANVILTPIRDPAGMLRGFAKVTRDLTERRRMEQEARRAEHEALEQSERARDASLALRVRDEFISVAAHELRTPLTALTLKIQGVEQALSKLGPEVDSTRITILGDRLRNAHRQVARLTELVERLLDVSRIAGGKLEINPEKVEMVGLVKQVLDDFREPASHARCSLRLQGVERATAWCDRARLEQVLVNLLANAIKYGAGKPVEVTVEELPETVRIAVKDLGIGIEPKDFERIFSCFERAAPLQHYAGLGLGLYISKRIIAAHGGKIQVASRPGQGASFTVDLSRTGLDHPHGAM